MDKLKAKLKPTVIVKDSDLPGTQTASIKSLEPGAIPDALAAFDQLPNSAHVRLAIVAPLFSTSTATVWRWVKSGRLPAPKKLGPNTTAWNVGDLRRAMAAVQEI